MAKRNKELLPVTEVERIRKGYIAGIYTCEDFKIDYGRSQNEFYCIVKNLGDYSDTIITEVELTEAEIRALKLAAIKPAVDLTSWVIAVTQFKAECLVGLTFGPIKSRNRNIGISTMYTLFEAWCHSKRIKTTGTQKLLADTLVDSGLTKEAHKYCSITNKQGVVFSKVVFCPYDKALRADLMCALQDDTFKTDTSEELLEEIYNYLKDPVPIGCRRSKSKRP